MSRIIAYIRTSTDRQDLSNQKLEIYEFAHIKNIIIDEFVEVVVSTKKTEVQRKIYELKN